VTGSFNSSFSRLTANTCCVPSWLSSSRDLMASQQPQSLVGLNGEAIHLLVHRNSADLLVARTEQSGWASFPTTHTEKEYSAVLVVSGPSASREVYRSDMTATFPRIEMLPDHKILVVASRCDRNQERVLFFGGYDERRTACNLLQLGDVEAKMATVDIPGRVDHTFRGQTDHLFRGKPIRHSEACRSAVPRSSRSGICGCRNDLMSRRNQWER
jgi:hypothetical protein